MIFVKEILLRARAALLLVFFAIMTISYRIIDLQFLNGAKWRSVAQTSQLAYRPIVASRGNIYSDDQSLLATSLPFYRVALDPTVVSEVFFKQDIDLLSKKLADFYGEYAPSYYKKRMIDAREKKKGYLLLHTRLISYEEKKEMLQWPIFNQGRFKGGVIFEEVYKRHNPFGSLAKRTIGTYREVHGSGLEHAFNNEIKGRDGRALYQKLAGGHWKLVKENTLVRPMHGHDLETTIDINLQDVTQSSLQSVLEKTCAQRGCAIVMEVATGAIKAIANLSRTESGNYVENYNYAVGNQGSVEPGSTFKLASMLALLEETKWPLHKPVDTGDGAIQFHNAWMRDVKKGGYGLLTLQRVFEQSSNVGIAMLTDQVFGGNPQKFIDYLEGLGLHQPLAIELVGEGKPYMITPKSRLWNKITLPWLSVGYNVRITPLQMLTLYNAVANNGKMVKPMLVQCVRSAHGVVNTFAPTVLKEQICSDETLQKLKIMLAGTVESGLAQRIKYGFYQIAGKTGTAQKLVNRRYTNHHLTSFAGYFPVDNPRYSCIIVVDDPQGKNYRFAAEVAAPIFRDIVERIGGKDLAARKFIHESLPSHVPDVRLSNIGDLKTLSALYPMLNLPMLDFSENSNLEACWVRCILRDGIVDLQPYVLPSLEKVPLVLGMKLREALFFLEKYGLQVTVVGTVHGTVYKQSLFSGMALPVDRKITIHLK